MLMADALAAPTAMTASAANPVEPIDSHLSQHMRVPTIHSLHKPIRRVLRIVSGSDEFYGTTSRYAQFDGDAASDIMNAAISSKAPFMAARFGSVEMECIAGYLNPPCLRNTVKLLRGEIAHFGWKRELFTAMETNAGFFPSDPDNLSRFSQLMLTDLRELDILGSWLSQEAFVSNLFPAAKKIRLRMMEPYWSSKPWSKQLKNKKVLVVHPFEATIRYQYSRREKLFHNSDILPEFDLQIIRAVQSIGGNRGDFDTWFDALEYLKSEIAKRDFEIAVLGCGAYGFPLAAHIKRMGKQSVHMGGAVQLLFGIKGARWESMPTHAALFNEHWIRPLPADVPENFRKVEGGCYW